MRNNKRAGVEQGTPCLLVPAEELRAQKDYGDCEATYNQDKFKGATILFWVATPCFV